MYLKSTRFDFSIGAFMMDLTITRTLEHKHRQDWEKSRKIRHLSKIDLCISSNLGA